MIIYNPIQKKEQHIENIKLVTHNLPNKKGEYENIKYVEFTVIGNNNKWTDFLSYIDFKNANENIEITRE